MRKLLSIGAVVAAVLAVVTPVLTNVGAQAAVSTTVVLSFDEGWANQSVVPAMLDAHGMKGTFYVNSGTIDQPGWLTWSQLLQIQADGHEIGGASVNQEDLAALETATPGAAQTSICEDRGRLMKHGITNVTDFAYPYGSGYDNAAVEAAVAACGYNSGRRQWGIVEANETAASLSDLYAIETAAQPTSATTVATLEAAVTNASSHGGGVVPFVFHQICAGSGCNEPSIAPATLNSFLGWLQSKAPAGTVVKTMQQVIGGSVAASPGTADNTAPSSALQCDNLACQPSYTEGLSISVSMLGTDEVSGSGIDQVRFTTDGTAPTIYSPVYTAPFPITYTTTLKYAAWDNAGNIEPVNTTTITIPDTIDPTSSVLCGGVSCDGGYFNPQTPITFTGIDNGSGIKAFHYTTNGATPTLASATYTGPFTVPANATIKYFAVDNANNSESFNSQSVQIDAVAPVAATTCDAKACSTGWYRKAVKVAMSATDGGSSGLAGIHYTLDNSTPTAASRLYTAPITLTASKWVKFVAVDHGGNVSAVKSKLVQIDKVKPVVGIKPGDGKTVTGVVKLAIGSKDGKSGVAKLVFSIDGHKVKATKAAKLAINWNTAKSAKGKHTLTATAIDKAGNSASKTVHVFVV